MDAPPAEHLHFHHRSRLHRRHGVLRPYRADDAANDRNRHTEKQALLAADRSTTAIAGDGGARRHGARLCRDGDGPGSGAVEARPANRSHWPRACWRIRQCPGSAQVTRPVIETRAPHRSCRDGLIRRGRRERASTIARGRRPSSTRPARRSYPRLDQRPRTSALILSDPALPSVRRPRRRDAGV